MIELPHSSFDLQRWINLKLIPVFKKFRINFYQLIHVMFTNTFRRIKFIVSLSFFLLFRIFRTSWMTHRRQFINNELTFHERLSTNYLDSYSALLMPLYKEERRKKKKIHRKVSRVATYLLFDTHNFVKSINRS